MVVFQYCPDIVEDAVIEHKQYSCTHTIFLLAQLSMQGLAGYVFPNYYGSATAQAVSQAIGSFAVLFVCAPLASGLAARFGKKELSTVGSISGAVVC